LQARQLVGADPNQRKLARRSLLRWLHIQISEQTIMISAAKIIPVALLIVSNVFMTVAWYGHLKFTARPLWVVVIASWSIAFVEYCFAVPANRIGHSVYSAAELKAIQEITTLLVFAVFSVFYLHETMTLNHVIGFGFIALGAFFMFRGGM
jgi:uncharacterized protein (DUF486 family)